MNSEIDNSEIDNSMNSKIHKSSEKICNTVYYICFDNFEYLYLFKYYEEKYKEYPIMLFLIFSIVIIIAIIDFLIRLFFFILFICLYLYFFGTCMIYAGNLCIKILIYFINIKI